MAPGRATFRCSSCGSLFKPSRRWCPGCGRHYETDRTTCSRCSSMFADPRSPECPVCGSRDTERV